MPEHQKLVFLFGRKPGLSADEFARHYVDVHAPLGLRVTRAMARYVVNLVDPDQSPLAAGGVQGAPALPLDAITEIWTPSVEAFFDPEQAFVSPEAGRELMADHDSFIGPMHAYVVTERIVKDHDRTWAPGERSPGVKYMSLMYRAEGMSPDEFDAYWRDRHTPLALEHHTGMWKYVQNTVVRALTPGAPAVDGFVEMHFPTLDDFRDRYFAGPASVPVIVEDAYRFISPATTSYLTSEYVQKP